MPLCVNKYTWRFFMSTKLTTALEFANYRETVNNQLATLKGKTQALLSYSINGGTFTINRELIAFCNALSTNSPGQMVVLLDIYDNPIRVDIHEFYTEIVSRYTEVTNDYYHAYSKIQKSRKVKKVLDIKDD